MNWITTNLRLPEDIYMEIKMKAARERRSIAAVIREKLTEKDTQQTKQNVLEMMRSLGKDIEKENKGLNLTEGLLEMRYEQ